MKVTQLRENRAICYNIISVSPACAQSVKIDRHSKYDARTLTYVSNACALNALNSLHLDRKIDMAILENSNPCNCIQARLPRHKFSTRIRCTYIIYLRTCSSFMDNHVMFVYTWNTSRQKREKCLESFYPLSDFILQMWRWKSFRYRILFLLIIIKRSRCSRWRFHREHCEERKHRVMLWNINCRPTVSNYRF